MRLLKPGLLLALVLFAIAFPVLLSPNTEVTAIAVFTLIFALTVTGWNIFSGYTGYISLGHAAYFGLGAYPLALASQSWRVWSRSFLPFLWGGSRCAFAGTCSLWCP